MKLIVYKGFDAAFFSQVEEMPLVETEIEKKQNVLLFDKTTRKQLRAGLLGMEEDETAWMTYEEYTLVQSDIETMRREAEELKETPVQVLLYVNNLYPDYYPLPFALSDALAEEITRHLHEGESEETSTECLNYLQIYNTLESIGGTYYGSFYNFEYERDHDIATTPYYSINLLVKDEALETQYEIFLNDDVQTYLRDLSSIQRLRPETIGVKMAQGLVSRRLLASLKAYCGVHGIQLVKSYDVLEEDAELEHELIEIARDQMHIKGFQQFRAIKFYQNPDLSKEIIEIPQSTIIREIIRQAERAYNAKDGLPYRDIFITASTGAGKSVMFQVPAIYLANHYNKLTIIIEPVKALMQDQKEKLVNSGYTRVETFNSDLITQVEKEQVLRRVKDGEVDLLYLSPETLLSYSLETIIGDREIGLIIIDEAHIVTSWGKGFRPDYWYLGGYINRLRNAIQTTVGRSRKTYRFPICAFTATAINGGLDDTVSETVISLYMENPVKFIGYVRRDDISFDIQKVETMRIATPKYHQEKVEAMNRRIATWLAKKQKTIVYFPYARNATDAARGLREFDGIRTSDRIGIYTGRNMDDMGLEAFHDKKRESFERFRSGKNLIMYATKAFGMGVDIDDIQTVYHYAPSGNLCDYVQEIGRAARKPGMNGVAATDFFPNDMTFIKTLFGMSRIRQYQIFKVLQGIYDTYRTRNGSRNFLISPQSFTYIFSGRGKKDEAGQITKLKTCLLMLEKDFYDKYNFKVLISRPQSVFTKAFVVVHDEAKEEVLDSEYGKYFHLVAKGRTSEVQKNGDLVSDAGDVYTLDLKRIWEEFYANISFPQFKYWYFNSSSKANDKIDIMPSIRKYISPRQKITVEARGDVLLSEVQDKILEDVEYISEVLHQNFSHKHFRIEEFINCIAEKHGKTQARVIAHSLFDVVDPNRTCVKKRISDGTYYLAHGNFQDYMRRSISKAGIMFKLQKCNQSSYQAYMSMSGDWEWSLAALKLLSIFDHINYQVAGGEEPEIFIRLNDPNKIKNIVLGNESYSNDYVNQAKRRYERDLAVLMRFFRDLDSDEDRWDYIEHYFLGHDILAGAEDDLTEAFVEMRKAIDKEKSFATRQIKVWSDLVRFFDTEGAARYFRPLAETGIPIPEYMNPVLKKSDLSEYLLMAWPKKNVAICHRETPDYALDTFAKKGWTVYRINEVDYDQLKSQFATPKKRQKSVSAKEDGQSAYTESRT